MNQPSVDTLRAMFPTGLEDAEASGVHAVEAVVNVRAPDEVQLQNPPLVGTHGATRSS
jgi:hypothetical protein